ncbi:TRIO and F-actin-binding protein [Collichthys lucidus]|uniref:TRIO and F-actin-binding protein n=1 Tax=Collichthys lucidus TaxID=240159 RepID=A0A4U5VSB5_COLLU|nr:TRIO and F-actin-binding protein [Collichthys lucidus]
MPVSSDEPICPKFQPNIFDPSRCHDCLRQRHLHAGAGAGGSAEAAVPQQKSTDETGIGAKINVTDTGTGPDKGVFLTPIPSQAEERDTSSKEDSDGVSVVSSYCDVNGGRLGYQESSFCILSPDCELYICDGDDDDSTDSCQDQSDYQESSSSVSADDEYPPIRRPSTKFDMTRLDPPPHRPNPRAWMDEDRGRDSFNSRSGLKEDREKRESGYFSLGRATGSRVLHDNNPPTPYRHFERGHPIYSSRNVEPKDTIPFRNPNLGVASERQIIEPLTEDLPIEIPPPDPYEIAVEVEAQVGPRSPSPTPFKIAESLASTGRKGFNSSYGRGQSGRFDSSRQGSALQSRSSSPSRGNLPFRRSESTASLNRNNFDGGGRTQGTESGSRSALQGTHGRRVESGTLPRNFKSYTSSVQSQPSTVSDFRSALRKSEVNGSLTGRGRDSRGSSPPRRDYNPTGQMSLRKTEITSSSSNLLGRDSRTSSPSRRTSTSLRDNHSSSPPMRNYTSSSQSLLRKSESILSLSGRSHRGRCGSPIREGYDIESQALLRNQTARNGLNDEEHESPTLSPSRREYDTTQSVLRKTQSSPVGVSRGRGDSRSSSPGRRGYETPTQYQLRKTDTSSSLQGRNHDSRNSSPSRRSYDAPSQSLLRKSEVNSSVRGRDSQSRSSSPSRRSYDAPSQSLLRKSEVNSSVRGRDSQSRNSSPSRKTYEGPSQSLLRKSEVNSSVRGRDSQSQSSSPSRKSYDAPSQSLLRKSEVNSSVRGRDSQSQSSSPSRKSYEGPSQSLLRKSEVNSSVRGHDSYSSLPSRKSYDAPEQRTLRRTETNTSLNSKNHNSRNSSSSPTRHGNNDPPGYSILRTATNGESNRSFQRKNTYHDSKPDYNHSPTSCRESTHSQRGSSLSRPSSPPRTATNGDSSHSFQRKNTYHDSKPDYNHSPTSCRESTHSQRGSSLSRPSSPPRPATIGSRTAFANSETPRSHGSIRSGVSRHGREDRCPSPSDKRSSRHAKSPSPPPQIQLRRHTSSQSSVESSESGPPLSGSTGRNREEYATIADVPKVKIIHQKDEVGYMARPQNQQPSRRQELFKPASHSLSKHPSRERLDTGDTERDWNYGGSGYLSRAHSSTSLQPDLLNFKKGWMSKLDESGEWKKHWFVLTDAGLKYYRDSSAEEKDDLDGEIDLKSCVKVSEFDVEKNYGFQIQTREAAFTLSAMTAGIRRNWIEVLKKSVRPSSSPDLTQLPDSSSDKENSHSRFPLSSRRPLSRHADVHSEVPASAPPTHRRFDYVELSPVPASSGSLPASQREAAEGQGREHSQWQEERNTTSQWEAVLSRKGSGVGSNQRPRTEDEIERKWAEFERMPLKEMSSLPPMGSRPSGQSANEALQREVASLRQQLEQLQGGRGGGGGGGGVGRGGGVRGSCGPEAPCSRSLAAMERAHRQALDELQRQHERQIRELETEKDRLLLEETQDTKRGAGGVGKKA